MTMLKFNMAKVMGCAILVTFFCLLSKAQYVKDIDGKVYKMVKIGQRYWTTENLSVVRFLNGDSIFEAKTPEEWEKAGLSKKPAWCYYDNNVGNGKLYGKLYNWYAVSDPRGLAPKGLHIPTNADWTALTKSQGGVDIAGIKMKNTTGWNPKSKGTNRSGFTGLPGGVRNGAGIFSGINDKGQWWSKSETIGGTNQGYSIMLSYSSDEVAYSSKDKEYGFSVRVVAD